MSDLTPPTVGSARTSDEIAEELSHACETIRKIDFNAVDSCGDLRELLDARDTLAELCLRYRTTQGLDERTEGPP